MSSSNATQFTRMTPRTGTGGHRRGDYLASSCRRQASTHVTIPRALRSCRSVKRDVLHPCVDAFYTIDTGRTAKGTGGEHRHVGGRLPPATGALYDPMVSACISRSWAPLIPLQCTMVELAVSHSCPTSLVRDLSKLEEKGFSQDELVPLDGTVWRKLDRWILPLLTSFFLLDAVVSFSTWFHARCA